MSPLNHSGLLAIALLTKKHALTFYVSIDLTEDSLRKASRGAKNLEKKIDELKSTDAEKLQSEYTKLVEGLKATEEARDEDLIMSNPVLPQDLLTGPCSATLQKT